MAEWWGALDGAQQVFYGTGSLAIVVLMVQLLLTLIGTEMDADMDVSLDHDSGVGIISVRSVAAFLFGFGWTGAIVYKSSGLGPALVAGIAVGTILTAALIYLMRLLHQMRHSGNLDYRNAVGLVGSVYVTVPPSGKGSGQVEVLLQGRLAMADACTGAARELKSREKVKVVGLMDANTLLVEPLEKENNP